MSGNILENINVQDKCCGHLRCYM